MEPINIGLVALFHTAHRDAAWGVDNTLSRGVAERDPGQLVLAKASLGASATVVLGCSRANPFQV